MVNNNAKFRYLRIGYKTHHRSSRSWCSAVTHAMENCRCNASQQLVICVSNELKCVCVTFTFAGTDCIVKLLRTNRILSAVNNQNLRKLKILHLKLPKNVTDITKTETPVQEIKSIELPAKQLIFEF